MIATRGGKAAPEAPFVIGHREALIYMLAEAVEPEHGILCQYLFTAFSLKPSEEQGLTGAELAAVRRWRTQVSHLAALSRAARAQGEAGPGAQQAPAPRWSRGPGRPPTASTTAEDSQEDTAEPTLPAPDQQVGFAAHIKPLFRTRDRQSMSFALDLWSLDAVCARAKDILQRLRDGSMPCAGAWPAAKIEVFQRWIETGMQP